MTMDHESFYKASNLNGNPFRSNATFEDDPRLGIWAGYEKERGQFEKFLARSRAEQVGNSNFIMLYGDYGTGKSHALLWGNRWLRSLESGGKSLAYIIPTLKKDKGKLTFAGAFQDDLVAKTTLVDDVLQYRQFLGRCINRCIEEEGIGTDVSNETVIERIIQPVELYNFAKQLYRCEGETDVRALLSPKAMNDYQAMVLFTRVVNLFVYEVKFKNKSERFRQSVHLMIDELDDLGRCSPKEALEVNDLLRHIYDSCPSCFGLVIALSAEAELLASYFADYVLSRVNKQIQFDPLDRAGAVAFIKKVMDEMRQDKVDPSRKGFFPFDQEAVTAIVGQLTYLTPRKIVNVMQQVIEEVRLADLDASQHPIGVADLDRTNIIEEVLGDGNLT